MVIGLEQKYYHSIRETSLLQQTRYWAKLKQKQGLTPKAFRFKIKDRDPGNGSPGSQYLDDDLLVLLQYPDEENSIAYVPYGPRLEPAEDQQGLMLEELSESLRTYLPQSCFMIRYDLPWESHWARDEHWYDPDHNWLGPPDKKKQEFRFNFNTTHWNLFKANTDILPAHTLFIDLKQSPGNLLSQMRSKTRYNIRLSSRRGVEVHPSGQGKLDAWQSLYKQTVQRNHLYAHSRTYFENVLETAWKSNDPGTDIKFLLAEKNGNALAAMFLAISGKRATYLYGVSSSNNRNTMAAYALQWEAIKRSREFGCSEYDMFGISPTPDPSHPMHGLYRFKTGFGGKKIHRMGCWDYPLDQEAYQRYRANEITAPGYHLSV